MSEVKSLIAAIKSPKINKRTQLLLSTTSTLYKEQIIFMIKLLTSRKRCMQRGKEE